VEQASPIILALEEQKRNMFRALLAVVISAGGEVFVPDRILMSVGDSDDLTTRQDTERGGHWLSVKSSRKTH